ncbi:MAG: phosphate signaling complex protein PhoU [Calditrichaeota bacterium]|nr:phosphate signaling complex protein PhoU [Calditrichota bacterium]RQW01927.1 MAG: phosphate signaling complex protein PhoU [Calditrichota bacterium]
MKEKMHQLIENIKKELIFLANEVEDAFFKALKAIENQDRKLAEEVLALNERIDVQEVKIEDQILSLLVLQQPVAVDLRFIVGALKMNTDLERIGDHAVNIAQSALRLLGEPYLKPLEDIPAMGKIARNMLHDSVHAFINQNTDLARDVCGRDDEVDDLYLKVLKDITAILKTKPEKIEQGIELIGIARDLERVADLATNLGEEVVFMREARIIRHGLG